MSDLVGNPEDRFSRDAACFIHQVRALAKGIYIPVMALVRREPREKTCLQGFRPGSTQTRLYNH